MEGIIRRYRSRLLRAVSDWRQNREMIRPTQLLHPAREAVPTRAAATVLLLRDGFEGIALQGTPVDCARVAMLGVLGPLPDVIVSGVNFGANMGNDVTYSGTVGAALEGALVGLPGVAISIEQSTPRYLESMESLLTALVERLILAPLPRGVALNVNLPDVPAGRLRGAKVTSLGGSSCYDRVVLQSDDGVHGEYGIVCERAPVEPWAANDFEAVAEGYVSLTPLQFDLTSREGLASLAAWPVDDLLRAARTTAG